MRFAAAEIALVLRLFQADLAHQRKRIALTVIAIAWGTLSIVLLLSFGEGLKRSLSKGARGMGEGVAVVWPGATTRAFMGLPSGRRIAIREEDAELLRRCIPEIETLSLEYARHIPVTAGTKSVNTRVRGVEPEFGEMRNLHPQAGGRFLNAPDMAQKRRVVFLGEELARDLYGTEDAVGRAVQINQSSFLVVGVARKKLMMGMYSGHDRTQATIPATSFKAMHSDAEVGNLVYRPARPELSGRAKAELYRVMGRKHHFDPEDTRALGLWDTLEMQRINRDVAVGVQIFLGIIGGLTLFVGGMGVANIMYAVVKERTREIGVKMALGAKARQVMLPFVLEALLMTVIGGILGAAIALLLIFGLAALPLENEAFDLLGRPTFSPVIAVTTALVLGTIGAAAGYFPARRAAFVDPAESLRYE
ncbi:MAG: ABC transporter permease [Vicinamibacteria bacterium]|nr:ABC transporter permease [Vicinamibacteria bacterium]